jgi:hypothetical protein
MQVGQDVVIPQLRDKSQLWFQQANNYQLLLNRVFFGLFLLNSNTLWQVVNMFVSQIDNHATVLEGHTSKFS